MDSIIGGLSNLRVDTVLSAVDKYVPGAQSKIKNLADKAKAYVNNVSDLEMKVLEATNHEPWGPHGSAMAEITNSSFNSEGFYQIMGVVDQRLAEGPDNWRLVYKTLLLMEYMLKHGPLAVAEALGAYSRLSHLEKLRDRFEFKDPAGRDQGINVRQRAGAIVVLLNDREKLKEERDKAEKNKSKYTGVSSSAARYGGFEGGGGSSSSRYGGFEGGGSSSSKYGGFEGGTSSSSSRYGGFEGGSSSSSKYGGFEGGSGAAAAASGGSSSSEPADPVEATRQRIARLKAEGAIAAGAGSSSAADGGSSGGALPEGGLDSPGGNERKPKKLSDIKINPAISAMFAKGGLAPPPSSAAAAAATSSSGIDLLGDLDGPAPAAAPAAADEWDGFASAGAAAQAPAAAAADEWASFESAPAASSQQQRQQQQPKVDINALLGALPTTSPSSSSSTSKGKAPLPLDDFCSMPAPAAAAAAMQPAAAAPGSSFPAAAPAAADPFGPFVATPAGSSGAGLGAAGGFGDPFAASGAVHMLPEARKQHAATGPKLGPETAKAKDPFADLLM
ncbi:hypothetical protein OEZ85_005890 [Tetradesmus obliquus]|uniref:ENTH domain-containing protein n=1 Tax=Tetradesmus obliquus TaxID=3088 RepID=A0ABY8UEU4_TETOB|nr:hypothetical protein OEZ85_005890 [Tetradesmus obliquus]